MHNWVENLVAELMILVVGWYMLLLMMMIVVLWCRIVYVPH